MRLATKGSSYLQFFPIIELAWTGALWAKVHYWSPQTVDCGPQCPLFEIFTRPKISVTGITQDHFCCVTVSMQVQTINSHKICHEKSYNVGQHVQYVGAYLAERNLLQCQAHHPPSANPEGPHSCVERVLLMSVDWRNHNWLQLFVSITFAFAFTTITVIL